jgi:hypothetical protein
MSLAALEISPQFLSL